MFVVGLGSKLKAGLGASYLVVKPLATWTLMAVQKQRCDSSEKGTASFSEHMSTSRLEFQQVYLR